jgi:pilus assembly protein Flp/PilA
MQSQVIRCREFVASQVQRMAVRRHQEGQGMVEYALILVLIALIVIVILTTVGRQVNNVFSNISHGLSS